MNTMGAALFGVLIVLVPTVALAQAPGPGTSGTVSALASRPAGGSNARPLFMLGNVAFRIWALVAPPYDVAADRNGAANPIR
jgi:hypothetical protein